MFSLSLTAQINTDRVLLMGRNALYYEDYVLAIQRFNMVIGVKPWLGEPYFYRALAKYYLEDYQGAEIDCSHAVERNPYALNHYVLRALCRINQDRYALAEEDYRKAISINPLERNSWHNIVLCQIELKQYEKADSSLDVMLRHWPHDAEQYTRGWNDAMRFIFGIEESDNHCQRVWKEIIDKSGKEAENE